MAGNKDTARGGRIKKRREAARLTQPALAQRMNVGYRTVQQWESGGGIPSTKLPLLAHALKTTVDYLLGKTDDPANADAAFEERLSRLEALAGALADDRVSGEQSARAGFKNAAQRIAEVRDAVTELRSGLGELRLSVAAQADSQATMLLQLQGLRRDVQALATSGKPGTSGQDPGKSQRPPRQANH